MSEDPDPGPAGNHLFRIEISDERRSPAGEPAVAGLASHALAQLGIAPGAELSIVLADPDRMADLKDAYMGERAPTDVLAFPMDGPSPVPGQPYVLGDVVLCPEVAREQAASLGRTYDEEMALLLVHGILHLLGHDHAEDDERERMQAEERRVLGTFAKARA